MLKLISSQYLYNISLGNDHRHAYERITNLADRTHSRFQASRHFEQVGLKKNDKYFSQVKALKVEPAGLPNDVPVIFSFTMISVFVVLVK
ncbi:hypothetical protein N431DRAFT_429118 [Stipitochalara longipes BDJ]|nr:hypothetical protein N431DRAFT_429118 [Stipitochalara longipes BDJ]